MPDAALHAHLVRLLVAGVASLVGGLSLAGWVPRLRAFGTMSAGWGLVDVLIALPGLRGGPPGAGFRPFLAFNLGLDLGYVGVGVAMWALGGERKNVRGFGQAVVVQGLILLVLDGALWLHLPATLP